MSSLLRNILAVIAGLFVGGTINMLLVTVSPSIIPPPAGVDVTNPESLAGAMALFEPRHFIMPFLAHALGTLAGAVVAYLLGANRRATLAYTIGIVFLVGGIAAATMIPAPAWFIALDLIAAYLPMAWLATRIGASLSRPRR